jgi:hypothetical protein
MSTAAPRSSRLDAVPRGTRQKDEGLVGAVKGHVTRSYDDQDPHDVWATFPDKAVSFPYLVKKKNTHTHT